MSSPLSRKTRTVTAVENGFLQRNAHFAARPRFGDGHQDAVRHLFRKFQRGVTPGPVRYRGSHCAPVPAHPRARRVRSCRLAALRGSRLHPAPPSCGPPSCGPPVSVRSDALSDSALPVPDRSASGPCPGCRGRVSVGRMPGAPDRPCTSARGSDPPVRVSQRVFRAWRHRRVLLARHSPSPGAFCRGLRRPAADRRSIPCDDGPASPLSGPVRCGSERRIDVS